MISEILKFLGNFSKHFELLNQFNSSFSGPYVNTEYYIGWLDHWGEKHSRVGPWTAANGLIQALQRKASVNMYMFYGGTNFGFTSGMCHFKSMKLLSALLLVSLEQLFVCVVCICSKPHPLKM